MKTMIRLVAIAALCISCGDNKTGPGFDGSMGDTGGGGPDAFNPPAAPTLGTQIDRFGRPAVNTALNHAFDPACTASMCAPKNAYNVDTNIAAWQATYTAEFMTNLGIIDALDNPPTTLHRGNQVLYNGIAGGGGTPGPTSYQMLGGLLAADELYLDTSKTMCLFYLAVEFGAATSMPNTTCGGRAPSYDVIDFSYSALAAGLS